MMSRIPFLSRMWMRRRVAREVRAEIEMHIQTRVDQLLDRGMTPEQARAAALEMFGDIGALMAECMHHGYERERRMTGDSLLGRITRDVRYAIRGLRRDPGFATAVIATLAIGIGANAAIFTVLDIALLRPLPYDNPETLINIGEGQRESNSSRPVRKGTLDQVLDDLNLQSVAFYDGKTVTRTDKDYPSQLRVDGVDDDLFAILGVEAAIGRTILPGDQGLPVIVVGWETYAADGAPEDYVGSTMEFAEGTLEIVGVMPRGFRFPRIGGTDAWTPLDAESRILGMPVDFLNLIGRLSEGQTIDAARANLDAVMLALADIDGSYEGYTLKASQLVTASRVNQSTKRALWLLWAAVLLILGVAVVNSVNLLLVRGVARSREVAIRLAIGGSQREVIRQMAVEAVTLAFVSSIIAAAIAQAALRLITPALPSSITFSVPEILEVDFRVMLYVFAVAMVVGITVGLIPALRVVRSSRAENLGAVSSARGVDRGKGRLGRGLVVLEVSMSVLLLAVASLLGRSFMNLTSVDTGFDDASTIGASLSLPGTWGAVEPAGVRLISDYEARLERLPEIESVAFASGLPPDVGFRFNLALETEDGGLMSSQNPTILPIASVPPDYWSTLGVELVAGRNFEEGERPEDHVVIIDEPLARALWGDASAIGRRFRLDEDADWWTVVGVANDVKMTGYAEPHSLGYDVFEPFDYQSPPLYADLVVRFHGEPELVMAAMRRELRALNPHLPLIGLGVLRDRMIDDVTEQEFNAQMMAAFAVIGLLLAAVGIYGVLSFAVRQRRRDIGVRIALGASTGRIVGGFLREGLLLAVSGSLVGVAILVATRKVLSGFLFDLPVLDPLVIGLVLSIIVAATVAASSIPSRRAASVDPVTVLKAD